VYAGRTTKGGHINRCCDFTRCWHRFICIFFEFFLSVPYNFLLAQISIQMLIVSGRLLAILGRTGHTTMAVYLRHNLGLFA
jgi:hypothetical protein